MEQVKRRNVQISLRFDILNEHGFKCYYCGATPKHSELEIDHLIPVAKGGTNEKVNLVPACFNCNRGKSDTLLKDYSKFNIGNWVMESYEDSVGIYNTKRPSYWIPLELLSQEREKTVSNIALMVAAKGFFNEEEVETINKKKECLGKLKTLTDAAEQLLIINNELIPLQKEEIKYAELLGVRIDGKDKRKT